MWRTSWYVIKNKIRLTAKTITTTIEHKMDNGIWFQIFMECIVAIKLTTLPQGTQVIQLSY